MSLRVIATDADLAEGAAHLASVCPVWAQVLPQLGPLPLRRRADGSLYSVTDPPRAGGDHGGRELDPDDVEALLALERRVRDGVGLPTP